MDEMPPDSVLREMAEETMAWQAEFDKVLKAGIAGYVACRRCGADARWDRTIKLWSLRCPSCEWSACGSMSASEIAN